jgi:hypothetical protein
VKSSPEDEPRHEILLAVCAAGVVLFNFPMLILWDRDATVFGLPLLPVALFAIWAAFIGALAWASERRRNRNEVNRDWAQDRTGPPAAFPEE